ncbi:MAG TPA: ribosome maturation factor RimP [Candidatus Acetatifactor stercoripullorum]|uniref:Ribosome maturation factor RimP n=1 Tax=Candidatus Acetatifactor stercoripullorum TaxID=2838414 RepID=A0A9D1R6M0_9FIRM|nr:ribosome maturation factor RimP [Candidatus Acetatifactor stercoripullorum]HIW81992.1 ribosome maturation factor RimP [Candidatus Acetatifactor stercoripullorum]
MSRRETYEMKTQELLEPIAQENGVEIYDVEYVKEGSDYYLRAYIDKEGGVNILDCEKVSRALSEALDKEDFIPDAYILEVSSPGLGRTLKKDKHLEKSIGQTVEVKLFSPVDKCKEFTGILQGFDEECVTILEGDAPRTFARPQIALIRLALDF